MTELLFFLGAIVIAGGLIWFLARQSEQKGAAEQKAAQTKDVLDAVQENKAIENEVAAAPISSVRERLSKWIAR